MEENKIGKMKINRKWKVGILVALIVAAFLLYIFGFRTEIFILLLLGGLFEICFYLLILHEIKDESVAE